MRRLICITTVLLFLATIFTGIAELHVHPGSAGSHVFIAVLLIASTLIHVIINRKSFIRYFTRPQKQVK